jgi:DNA-binding NarL/FixJ family response regulator
MAPPLRVLVVDDHHAVRTGLLAMLADEPGIEPAGAAGSAGEAHEAWLSARERIDVVLVDYHLPDEDGLSLCLWLKTTDDPPAVVIYSGFADALAMPALIAGADGLVGKSSDPMDVGEVIRAVAAGERRLPELSPQIAGDLGRRLADEDMPILGMLRHGVPAAEIAETLGLAPRALVSRRWAMLEQLIAAPERLEERRFDLPGHVIRNTSLPRAITSPAWS